MFLHQQVAKQSVLLIRGMTFFVIGADLKLSLYCFNDDRAIVTRPIMYLYLSRKKKTIELIPTKRN